MVCSGRTYVLNRFAQQSLDLGMHIELGELVVGALLDRSVPSHRLAALSLTGRLNVRLNAREPPSGAGGPLCSYVARSTYRQCKRETPRGGIDLQIHLRGMKPPIIDKNEEGQFSKALLELRQQR